MKYKVKLIFKYSDIVHVEASSQEEAIREAMVDCDEEFECFFDAEVEEETSD